jgi:lipoprotein-anchoring transpeptidase ErfK/SrfK
MNKAYVRTFAIAAALAGTATLSAMGYAESPRSASAVAPAPMLVADLSDKILYLYEGDSVYKMFDIADGKDPYPTPRGNFKIRKLNWNPRWVPPDSKWARNKSATGPGDPKNPMKVVTIFFKEPDYYIHGTDAIGSLGSSESHGCLRMAPDDVMEVGRWVMEHGGKPMEENWFKRILHSRREEKVIFLSNPVPIRVQP